MYQDVKWDFPCGPQLWPKSKAEGKKSVQHLSNSENPYLQLLSPRAELASNPYMERAKGQRVIWGFVRSSVSSPPYEKGEWVASLLSPKNAQQERSKRIISRNWGASKKGRWASIPELDAHLAREGKRRKMAAEGGQRQERQEEAAWVPTITYGKEMWASMG